MLARAFLGTRRNPGPTGYIDRFPKQDKWNPGIESKTCQTGTYPHYYHSILTRKR